ncbi:MAG: methyltransferase domain-containing protein [Nitrososphaerota archaeon]|nr:methyltransferase domain-containing protein [Candidatus Bathyarchaeota archaeon]MDW8048700.1 methyltransferase domain-containing protein [Nitrososphaerota archaeon]
MSTSNKNVIVVPKLSREAEIGLKHKEKFLSKLSVGRLLDVGCNNGEITLLYARFCRAYEVYGIDIDPSFVEAARGRGIKTFLCDINKDTFPFENEFFDLVTATEVLEHLYDTDHALSEIWRVLKRNGFFLISVPNLAAWHSRISLLLGFQPYQCEVSFHYHVGTIIELDGANGHIRAFTLRALRHLLERKGFEVLAIAGGPSEHIPKIREKLGRFPLILDNLLSRFPSIAGHVIILCKKR